MCFQFYEGKGYSADFTDHMGRVIKELEADPEQKVVLGRSDTSFGVTGHMVVKNHCMPFFTR
ncbi:hypothetical protein [Butyrivibrio proteoclasticus]|uniref:hypothetical protein n=1 Tax=Butyrivibrio proteoclasticus TaxID=43305 RepID=UPI000554B497|nr:hypothetical protein [Butyrivibrio proteoclasticus]